MNAGGAELRLRAYLAAQLRALASVLAVIVAVTAPTAFYVLGVRALSVQALAASRQVADVIRSDVERRPALWKYDALKLLEHLRNYELQESVARVEVVDDLGVPVDPEAPAALEALQPQGPVWQTSDVIVNNRVVARVWVAMTTADLRRQTGLLAAVFGVIALGLAALVYWLPLRAVGRAEAEIIGLLGRLQASKTELAALNTGLERLVEARSAQLSQALGDLQAKEQNLREISSRAVELQEQERRAIARDLHDAAGQTLTAIRINLQLVGELLAQRKPEQIDRVAQLAARTTALVDETVEEIRRAVSTLGPAVLEDVGLARALDRMCDDLEHRGRVVVERRIELEQSLSSAIETTCYRVVQEAFTNVMRHADAQVVTLDVIDGGDALTIEVVDDGTGFEQANVDPRRRGLIGMRERVEILGGQVEVASAPGSGTRVRARMPRTPNDVREPTATR
ncbi:MAG: sensor histidine kinase [Nannocystaceae bacterium]|nr:sensor histidine kinase [Nannocystaceae bacterium]